MARVSNNLPPLVQVFGRTDLDAKYPLIAGRMADSHTENRSLPGDRVCAKPYWEVKKEKNVIQFRRSFVNDKMRAQTGAEKLKGVRGQGGSRRPGSCASGAAGS